MSITFIQCRALTEKIVAMLPKMNCPYRIEPHQIQGLDCIHIFPVIQVLNIFLLSLPILYNHFNKGINFSGW